MWLAVRLRLRLGRVSQVGEPEQHGCEDQAAAVDDGVLVVSGGQPKPVFPIRNREARVAEVWLA